MTVTKKRPRAEDVAREEILLTAGRLTTLCDDLVLAYRKRRWSTSGALDTLDTECANIIETHARLHQLLALYPQKEALRLPDGIVSAAKAWTEGDESKAIELLDHVSMEWVTQFEMDESESERRRG